MKLEYVLAEVIRQLLEMRRAETLGAAISAASGLDIEDVDRSPRAVLIRLLQHPTVATRILTNPGTVKRLFAALTDQWEYHDVAE
jgi:digeranylgeranylglycerophospholipid reductase